MPNSSSNGRKFWWTPALALTLTCTLLGATSWVVETKIATVKEEVVSVRAIADERFNHLQNDIAHLQKDIAQIRSDLRDVLGLLKK